METNTSRTKSNLAAGDGSQCDPLEIAFLGLSKPIAGDLRKSVEHFYIYKSRLPISINENQDLYIDAFIELIGHRGSILTYRASIRHFLTWLSKNNKAIVTANLQTIEEYTEHTCGVACGARYSAISDTKPIVRFLIFLQFQGEIQDCGWTQEFPDCCESFKSKLISEGVSYRISNNCAKTSLHFVIWMILSGVRRSSVASSDVQAFVKHECRCGVASNIGRPTRELQADRERNAERFLRFLLGKSILFEKGQLIGRRDQLSLTDVMVRYSIWLSEHRGLRNSTINSYLFDIAKWLPQLGQDATKYSAQQIRIVASSEFEKRSQISQSKFISSIRSYLRFCVFEGKCDASLIYSIISRRSYKLSGVPKRLEPGISQQIIDSVSINTATGLRDRAILFLLAELGLRAGEVGRLTLDDLDWKKATIKIDGKGGRGAIVPLTQRSGDAIQLYLARGRPASRSNRLFIRCRRPYVQFGTPSEVANIAHKVIAKFGLKGGAHIFRHTLATELLRSGRTIEDVATVLRHTSIQTTMIYAKVNATMLQRLAVPWMGDGQ